MMQAFRKAREMRRVLSTLKLLPNTSACDMHVSKAQQSSEATTRSPNASGVDVARRGYQAVSLPTDSPEAGGLSHPLSWLEQRMFSASSLQSAETEPGSAAELNPLMQTPAPSAGEGADEFGQTRAGSPSAAGPGRARAVLRGIRLSPIKMAHFAPLIRRMHVEDALAQCRLTVKKAGRICEGVILSAVANAENNHGLSRDRLCVDIVNVGKGVYLKRMSIHGRGRSGIKHRYRCHLEVILKEGDMPQRMRYRRPLLERPRKHSG